MLSVAKILVPTDFSERSTSAAGAVTVMAAHFHAKVIVLHAVPPIDGPAAAGGISRIDELRAAQRAQRQRKLDTFLKEEFQGLDVQRVLAEGDPAEQILEYAKKEGVGLIMMPTRGCGPFRRFILGSVTAKVLHDAKCPVWTDAHTEEAQPPRSAPPKTIACAIDLTPEGESILRWAAELAAGFSARLVAIYAIRSVEFNPETYYLEAEMRKFLTSEATRKIQDMLAACGAPDAIVHVEGGSVPKVVRSAAADHQADLLVIGRASPGLLGRLRTNSYAIIRESPCPVISV